MQEGRQLAAKRWCKDGRTGGGGGSGVGFQRRGMPTLRRGGERAQAQAQSSRPCAASSSGGACLSV